MHPSNTDNRTYSGLRLCNHLFPDGHRCGSPALRNEYRCYHHQDSRRRASTRGNYSPAARARRRAIAITPPTGRRELQHSLTDLLHALAHNRIDPRRAGLLLTTLQTLALHMPG